MLRAHHMYTRVGIRHFSRSPTSLLFKKASQASTSQKVATQNTPDEAAYSKHPILKRVPRFLRPYTTQFINAPVSHVTAFIVLHEITAIVPLVGVWYLLHQYHDTLMVSTLDLPAWALEKGTKIIDKAIQDWDFGNYSLNDKFRFIKEGAYAYVIVKSLFPVRLAISLLGMPWFARWFVLPITRLFSRKKPETVANASTDTAVAVKEHNAKEVKNPRL